MITHTETLLQSLDRVMRLLRRYPHGYVSRGTHRILHLLHENEALSTREMAHRLDIRPSSLNETLSRLEQNGLIIRERDTQDQRIFLVRLTSDGEALRQKAFDTHLRGQADRLAQVLTQEEAETLNMLMHKLADGLEASSAAEERNGKEARERREAAQNTHRHRRERRHASEQEAVLPMPDEEKEQNETQNHERRTDDIDNPPENNDKEELR